MENKEITQMKRSLDAKSAAELKSQIQQRLTQGMRKEQIFDLLISAYYDKGTLANLIAQVPYPEKKEKLRSQNKFLVGILLTAAFFKFLTAIALLSKISMYALPLAVLVPALTLWFAKEVAAFKGSVYRIVGLLIIVGLMRDLGDLVKSPPHGALAISVTGIFSLLYAVSAFLAFHIGRSLFPTIGFFGVKQGEDGRYIFD